MTIFGEEEVIGQQHPDEDCSHRVHCILRDGVVELSAWIVTTGVDALELKQEELEGIIYALNERIDIAASMAARAQRESGQLLKALVAKKLITAEELASLKYDAA